jgi:hypothetical protein
MRSTSTGTATVVTAYARGFNQVCVSERLAAVLREFSVTEAPPGVTAVFSSESYLRRVMRDHAAIETRLGAEDARFESSLSAHYRRAPCKISSVTVFGGRVMCNWLLA